MAHSVVSLEWGMPKIYPDRPLKYPFTHERLALGPVVHGARYFFAIMAFQATDPTQSPKPKVLALGHPSYASKDCVWSFQHDFALDILDCSDRKSAINGLRKQIAQHGPYDGLLVRMATRAYGRFDRELLAPLLPHCRIIVSASAGYDEFDIAWMTENKITLCNTRQAATEATADMTIFLILAVLRDTTRAEMSARTGQWRQKHVPTRDPRGITLGMVGMGNVAQHVAKKATAFKIKTQYYSRTRLPLELERSCDVCYVPSLDNLLSSSDVVSLHCSLNEQTVGLIGEREFSVMKDGVFFINTSRGPVVDEGALIRALESGKATRAGLDVFENEPEINSFFKSCDRCTLQPHLGGLTDVSLASAEEECLANLRACFENGAPLHSVNGIHRT